MEEYNVYQSTLASNTKSPFLYTLAMNVVVYTISIFLHPKKDTIRRKKHHHNYKIMDISTIPF